MNCPSRIDPEALPNGWNQNPGAFELHSNSDFNGKANLTEQRDHRIPQEQPQHEAVDLDGHLQKPPGGGNWLHKDDEETVVSRPRVALQKQSEPSVKSKGSAIAGLQGGNRSPAFVKGSRIIQVIRKFARFIGPGFMVAVAYIDPGLHCESLLKSKIC